MLEVQRTAGSAMSSMRHGMPPEVGLSLLSPHAARPRATTGAVPELHAIVLAGGSGRRLEPFVRRQLGEAIPKQYCSFGSSRSLLQESIDRIEPLVGSDHVTVVVDRSQRDRALHQLAGFSRLRTIEQPCDRGTAAGVLLPLLDLLRRAPDAIVVLLASDHGIVDSAAFRRTIARAGVAVADAPDSVVLLGADADTANTDYGWIVRAGRRDPRNHPDDVARFVEKPQGDLAAALLRSGFALWNTMVLVARARTLADRIAARVDGLVERLSGWIGRGDAPVARDDYATLPQANFSSDVLESTGSLVVLALPASTRWTDLGTEERLTAWLEGSAVSAPRPAGSR